MWVYKLTNTLNGLVYVGKTGDLESRLYMHSRAHDHAHSRLHRAIRKHGFSAFTVEVLASGIATERDLDDVERHWISVLDSMDRSKGYNLTAGGDGMRGYRHSAATRAAWSAKRKGVKPGPSVIAGLRRAASRPKSEATRRKMSVSAKARPRGEAGKFIKRLEK